jgi:hypothetical protein
MLDQAIKNHAQEVREQTIEAKGEEKSLGPDLLEPAKLQVTLLPEESLCDYWETLKEQKDNKANNFLIEQLYQNFKDAKTVHFDPTNEKTMALKKAITRVPYTEFYRSLNRNSPVKNTISNILQKLLGYLENISKISDLAISKVRKKL